MAAIQSVADKHGLKVIEDCAQSFGASIKGQQTAAGAGGGFQLLPSKNLALRRRRPGDDQRRCHPPPGEDAPQPGSEVRYYHDANRLANSRLDELQAVVLAGQAEAV